MATELTAEDLKNINEIIKQSRISGLREAAQIVSENVEADSLVLVSLIEMRASDIAAGKE